MRFTALTFAVIAALSSLASAQFRLTPCAAVCAKEKCGEPMPRYCVCGDRRADVDKCIESNCPEGLERSQAQRSMIGLCGRARVEGMEDGQQAPMVEQLGV
ncbi:uncharacterized protein SCHCODRAFT_02638080 [Schizophyllum commune H4-8]|uniref:Extracellular membrane protein CFEM domain-containing protein n=1 Tax=Schizophyllum commune (strain H4-8 / FGSC 9210) TaxID=578458 RepID=D8QEZ5_SCHCM|nr:uncharacterized protein SCHCODRAFT_02638080 [Schizophyllum commune H4-8]KAI5887424.1 hypothetical protein SCHCODRAFT_02638080 [Schizophyllum commune H4-8]